MLSAITDQAMMGRKVHVGPRREIDLRQAYKTHELGIASDKHA